MSSLRPMPCASYQWSSAVRIVPSASLILAMPLRLRHRPGPYGLNKDGDPTPSDDESHENGRRARRVRQIDFTARQAMRSPSFWFISLGHASALLIVSALQVHLVLHMTEKRYPRRRQAMLKEWRERELTTEASEK